MDVDQPPSCRPPDGPDPDSLDLIGGPFAVIESDPGVFTSLVRQLGIQGLELVELYDIEPWAVDHLNPYGLIFCFLWHKDTHIPADFNDPAAERVWFANQLSDDACATHAVLNVVMNCPQIDLGEDLTRFRNETEGMSSVMKGLAVTNSPMIRSAHNCLARPCDLRASVNNLATTSLDAAAAKAKRERERAKPPPPKRARTGKTLNSPRKKPQSTGADDDEVYHFVGYVPAYNKVWELDGLKSGPLEVGELPPVGGSTTSDQHREWMDVARPALRMKMEKYGGSAEGGSNIRFSLLAIVEDRYREASDELEYLRREKRALEKRMPPSWEALVDPILYHSSETVFVMANWDGRTEVPIYAADFGARRLERDKEILDMSPDALLAAWNRCIEDAMRVKVGLEDEYSKGVRSNTEHIKRTFDYEPFIKEYTRRLHAAGLLNALLGLDDAGKKKPAQK